MPERSSDKFYGVLSRETALGSNTYTTLSFTPTVYEFDYDSETDSLSNVKLVKVGDFIRSRRAGHKGITSVSYYDQIKEYIGQRNSSWVFGYNATGSVTYGVGSYPCFGNPPTPSNTMLTTIYGGVFDSKFSALSIGAYYSQITGSVWLFFYGGGSTRVFKNEIVDTSYISWTEDYVEKTTRFVLNNFYGVSDEEYDTPKIKRLYPQSQYFSPGEESVLSYRLETYTGDVLSTTPSLLRVDTGTGWGYDESTKILRYLSGSWRTTVHVEFTYDDETYSINNIFYPSDTNEYTPGGLTSSQGVFVGGNGLYGAGTFGKPEDSDNVSADLPLGSVEGDASATGFYTRYLCNGTTLGIFGDWLWATDLGLQIAKTAISLLYGDPSEAVISLMSYPFNISSLSGVTTRVQDIFWGNFDSNVPSIALTSQAAYIDWGTITLDEYWGNFLDYSPHTKIDLFLPWSTGSVEIDPGECLPGTLRVVTNIDLNKGSCIHNVIGNNGSVIGQYAGQCGKQIPILSSDIASKSAGLVTAAVAIGASAVVSAGIGASAGIKAGADAISPTYSFASKEFGDTGKYFVERTRNTLDFSKEKTSISQAMRTGGKVASTALAAFKTPTHISRNGGFTDGSASLSIQYPYIILSRPYQSIPESYGHHYGYPSNIYAQLSSLVGYTEVGEIHLDGIPATDAELTELDRLLKGGVIL